MNSQGCYQASHITYKRQTEWVEYLSPILDESEPRGFESWLRQTNAFQIDTCRFLARLLELLW